MIIYPIIYRNSGSGSGDYPEPDSYQIDFTNQDSITVVHNSGQKCLVSAIDSSDDQEFKVNVEHINDNQCIVSWVGNKTGKLIIR